jgi:hypothetical protein
MCCEIPSDMPMEQKLPLILIGRSWTVYITAKSCPKYLRPLCSWYIAWKLRMKHSTVKSYLRFLWFASGEYFR